MVNVESEVAYLSIFACAVGGVSKTTELIISNLLQDNKIEWQARPASDITGGQLALLQPVRGQSLLSHITLVRLLLTTPGDPLLNSWQSTLLSQETDSSDIQSNSF